MEKAGLSKRDEEIKVLAREHFVIHLLTYSFILLVIIFLPYFLGKANLADNNYFLGKANLADNNNTFNNIFQINSNSPIQIWFSGLIGIIIIVISIVLIFYIGYGIILLYCYIWDMSFERALKDYNKKHKGKKQEKKE